MHFHTVTDLDSHSSLENDDSSKSFFLRCAPSELSSLPLMHDKADRAEAKDSVALTQLLDRPLGWRSE